MLGLAPTGQKNSLTGSSHGPGLNLAPNLSRAEKPLTGLSHGEAVRSAPFARPLIDHLLTFGTSVGRSDLILGPEQNFHDPIEFSELGCPGPFPSSRVLVSAFSLEGLWDTLNFFIGDNFATSKLNLASHFLWPRHFFCPAQG
jgi:hypothetical protein